LHTERNNALAELELNSVLSRNYPYVRLSSGYGYTLDDYGTGMSARQSNLGFNAAVTVGFTIFDGNRKRERANANIAIANARLRQQELEQTLRADINNLWQAYCNNIRILKLERENLTAAKENHDIARERYLLGNLSGIDMREAQKSLLDAEERILTAEYDTKLCEISLLQISGRVTQYLE
jgi:outer membrane protein TolC